MHLGKDVWDENWMFKHGMDVHKLGVDNVRLYTAVGVESWFVVGIIHVSRRELVLCLFSPRGVYCCIILPQCHVLPRPHLPLLPNQNLIDKISFHAQFLISRGWSWCCHLATQWIDWNFIFNGMCVGFYCKNYCSIFDIPGKRSVGSRHKRNQPRGTNTSQPPPPL